MPSDTTGEPGLDLDALEKVLEAADAHAESQEILTEERDDDLDAAIRSIYDHLRALRAEQ